MACPISGAAKFQMSQSLQYAAFLTSDEHDLNVSYPLFMPLNLRISNQKSITSLRDQGRSF